MRACGNCGKAAKKYGPPQRHGDFLDQIVVCARCDWVGVETEIIEDKTAWQPVLFVLPEQSHTEKHK